MSNFRIVLRLALALGLSSALVGCPLAIVGGLFAAGGAGYAANQERGVGGTAKDFSTKTDVQSAWAKADPAMQADLNVTVYEGRTLLTGTAPDTGNEGPGPRGRQPGAGSAHGIQ